MIVERQRARNIRTMREKTDVRIIVDGDDILTAARFEDVRMHPVSFEDKQAMWFKLANRSEHVSCQFINQQRSETPAQSFTDDPRPSVSDVVALIQDLD